MGFTTIGWVFIIFSIGATINMGIEAALISLPGIIILLSHVGVLIDPERRRIKEYVWAFFVKFGRWQVLGEGTDILVLQKKRTLGYNLRGIGPYFRTKESTYEIYFATPNHLSKVLVCRKYDKEQAYEEARKIGNLMGCELVAYNPGRRRPRKVL